MINALYLIPTLLYTTWAISYFLGHVLTPRKFIRHPNYFCYLFSLVILSIGTVIKIIRIDIGTTAIQIGMLLITMLLFQDSLRLRITCYAVFMLSLAVIEVNASNIFLFLTQLISHNTQASTAVNAVNNIFDILLLSVLNISFGILFFRKATPLLGHFLHSIKTRTFLQLLFPLYLPFIIQILIYQKNFSVRVYALIYFLPLLVSGILFIKGIQNVKIQEKERIIKLQNIQLS